MKQFRFIALSTLVLASVSAGATQWVQIPNFMSGVSAIAPQSQLTEKEAAGLRFMREEEKLALDVYTKLAQKWGANPFQNIAQSELSHANAVLALLTNYGIPDPAANLGPGVFKDKTLQKFYDDLIKAGSVSRVEALRVGATIEDLDLNDLDDWLSVTTRPDIRRVYENLARGSRIHLRSFVRALKNAGVTYKPVYISQEAFDKIISTPNEPGGPGGRGRPKG